jgi:hypothetical protein
MWKQDNYKGMKEKKSYDVFERGKTIGRQLVLQKKLPQKRKVSVHINPGENRSKKKSRRKGACQNV